MLNFKINSIKFNRFHLVILLIPLLITVIAFFNIYQSPYTISQDNIITYAYGDKANNGNSECNLLQQKNESFSFKYTLKEGIPFPFAGIAFTNNTSDFFDFSGYNHVEIKIKASQGKRIPFIITTHVENLTQPGNFLTYRNLEYILNVDKNPIEFSIPLKDLKTPSWWYSSINKRENEFSEPDFSKVKTVNIASCFDIQKGTEDTVTIHEITFYKDLSNFYFYAILLSSTFYIIALFFILNPRVIKKAELNFHYKKIDSVNHFEKEEEAVFNFLTLNYFQQELTIIDVQNSIGISEAKISGIIKRRTQMNFKQFLNRIRITEAKRLLSETDLQISEIAFKVGYGNISNFNRVFKESEGITPNDFRKKEIDSSQKV